MPAKTRPESVLLARDSEVLSALLNQFSRPGAMILDTTAGLRRMWSRVDHMPAPVFLDSDPALKPDVVGSFLALPFEPDTFDVIVFDPPHLPAAAASPLAMQGVSGYDFGLAQGTKGNNNSVWFPVVLAEVRRVLRPEGVLFAKIKDFVHNHAYQWSTVDFVNAVRATEGLTACDHWIKRDPCGGNLKSGRWVASHHARVCHCSWIVVRKGRCEPRPVSRTARSFRRPR